MIRKVRQEEVHLLYPFVYRILSDMDLPLLDTINGDELTQIIVDAMESPQYRYGYEHAWVCIHENQIAGVLFGYPGEHIPLVDGPLQVALAERGIPTSKIIQNPETHAGEWYLDAIVTAPIFRNQGIGRRLLQIIDNVAKEAGYTTIGLNCPADNQIAYHLYTDIGFEVHTKILLENKIYFHMTKDI